MSGRQKVYRMFNKSELVSIIFAGKLCDVFLTNVTSWKNAKILDSHTGCFKNTEIWFFFFLLSKGTITYDFWKNFYEF